MHGSRPLRSLQFFLPGTNDVTSAAAFFGYFQPSLSLFSWLKFDREFLPSNYTRKAYKIRDFDFGVQVALAVLRCGVIVAMVIKGGLTSGLQF